jgi:hypothetical protein
MADLQSRASTNLARELTNKAGELAYTNYGAERAAQERAIQSTHHKWHKLIMQTSNSYSM